MNVLGAKDGKVTLQLENDLKAASRRSDRTTNFASMPWPSWRRRHFPRTKAC